MVFFSVVKTFKLEITLGTIINFIYISQAGTFKVVYNVGDTLSGILPLKIILSKVWTRSNRKI